MIKLVAMSFRGIRLLIFYLAIIFSYSFAREAVPLIEPVRASQGMISTQEAIATKVGLKILQQGGNAIDAAVATGFALAVTYPQAGNIGGGGFMMIYLADKKTTIALDYREMAPAAAHRDMFLNKEGEVDNKKARFSHLSSGVPGTVAGMIHALEKYGTLPLEEVIAPAIELAEKGIIVSSNFHNQLSNARNRHKDIESTKKIFYPGRWARPVSIGEIFVQKDLAWSLKQIATGGVEAFYKGAIAKKISADSQKHGGIITMADMANYRVVERNPVEGQYRGYRILSMPPPSSGGVHLVQMLNILEGWDLQKTGLQSAITINFITETMKLAYADRSIHLGDPDFVEVPVQTLISKQYAAQLHGQISANNFIPSTDISPGKLPVFESPQTTHYSIIDKHGNAVANTYTLNATFGNGRVAEGTGIIMNNEMDDFSSKPGSPNMFGLIGGTANAIEAGKRPLSSMTPTLIIKDEEVFMATGSIGGSRIITSVLQVIINVIDHRMDIAAATIAPRFHHQWHPDSLLMESGFEFDVINQLRKIGYSVDAPDLQGNSFTPTGTKIGMVQSIVKNGSELTGYSDQRRTGSLTLGY